MSNSADRGRVKPIRGFIEVMLIALGVLAGLSADAWLGAQAERQLERDYLDALAREIDLNRVWLSTTSDVVEGQRRDGEAMIEMALGGEPGQSVPLHDFLVLFGFQPFEPVTATVDQLIASGDLSVLRSVPLRTSLATWTTVAHAQAEYVNLEQWQHWGDSALPFLREYVGSVEFYASLYGRDSLVTGDDPREVALSDRVADALAERLVVASDALSSLSLLDSLAAEVSEALSAAR